MANIVYVTSPYALYEVRRTLALHFPLRTVWSIANTVTSLPLTHSVKNGEHCLRHFPLRAVWSIANTVTSLPLTQHMKYGGHWTSLPLTHCMKHGEHCHVTSPYAMYEVWRTLSRHLPLHVVLTTVTSPPPSRSAHHCNVTSPFT